MQSNVAVIVGSLRQAGYSRLMARAIARLAPPSMRLVDVPIGDLPLYNEDLETATPPAAWTGFREAIAGCEAVLFVTPEYNRSMPGAMKNALDVGSRPWGKSVWSGKPAAVVSVSPGALGGMASNLHLRQVLYAVNLVTMPHPEAYIAAAGSLFDEGGQLASAATREFLTGFLQAFETWIRRQRPALAGFGD
ncbi:MAG: ACP phosphodiesterase [Proteobacteria bacterium]|nr:MAG: ACP phosphodiesterase [Pseudomonadota bacterium]